MKWSKKSLIVGLILVSIAAASRLLPHWHNFTAVGGVALFSAYYFKNRFWSYLVPLLAMWISDLFLNNIVYTAFNDGFVWFSTYMIWGYLGFASMVLVGSIMVRKGKRREILLGTMAGTLVFFIITNFGSFLYDPIYLKTPAHLWLAYIAGLPFLLNSFLANVFYAAVFFGAYSISSAKSGIFRPAKHHV